MLRFVPCFQIFCRRHTSIKTRFYLIKNSFSHWFSPAIKPSPLFSQKQLTEEFRSLNCQISRSDPCWEATRYFCTTSSSMENFFLCYGNFQNSRTDAEWTCEKQKGEQHENEPRGSDKLKLSEWYYKSLTWMIFNYEFILVASLISS